MSIVLQIKKAAADAIRNLYQFEIEDSAVLVNATKPEFEGDYTVVLFAFVKQLKKSPDALGEELGQHIVQANPELFTGFNVIKGFLNLTVADNFWLSFIQDTYNNPSFGYAKANGEKVMVEY